MRLTRGRVLMFLAIASLPAWLLVTGEAHRVWAKATMDLYQGATLYERGGVIRTNPWTTRYPYLPQFAYVNALLWLPPWLAVNLLQIGDETWFTETFGFGLTASWGYTGALALAYAAGEFVSEERVPLALLAMAAFPQVIVHGLVRGVDLWVAALFLVTVLLARRERWLLAGIAVSLAATKFTGVPVILVAVAYAWWSSRDAGLDASLGVVIGQVPNLAYFATHWDDFRYVVRHRGALGTDALAIPEANVFLLPIRAVGLADWYVHGPGFAVVLVSLTVVGVVVAVRIGLLPGLAVAYFPMGYLAPAENRYLPLLALVLVMLFEVADTAGDDGGTRGWPAWGLSAFAVLFVLRGYYWVFEYGHPDRLPGFVAGRVWLIQAEMLFHVALLVALVVVYRRRAAESGKSI